MASIDSSKIIEDKKALKASGMPKKEDRDRYSEMSFNINFVMIKTTLLTVSAKKFNVML